MSYGYYYCYLYVEAYQPFSFQSKGGESALLGPKEFFRLEQLQEEFNFCDDEAIDENKRFRLIYLRDSEVTEFKNYKMIPLLDRDIPRDTFAVPICIMCLICLALFGFTCFWIMVSATVHLNLRDVKNKLK